MSRERFNPAIVEDFERELRQVLTLEPSADFHQQVRARIERGRARRLWTASRAQLAAAAVCVLALGIGWQLKRDSVTPVQPAVGTPRSGAGTDIPLMPDRASPPIQPSLGRPAFPAMRYQKSEHVRRRNNVEVTGQEPEVLVPEATSRAVARLLALVREGGVDETILKPVVPAPAPLTLDIAPIAVTSIPLPTVEGSIGEPRGGADPQ